MTSLARFSALLAASLPACALLSAQPAQSAPACPPAPQLQPCFTPGGDCQGLIVSVIDGSRREVLLQTYKFTSKPILSALARAAARGVRVRMVLDEKLEERDTKTFQKLEGTRYDIRMDDTVKTAHNKVIVADRSTVITGSFNFTHGAEAKNAENLLVIRNSPEVARAYADNWQHRYDVSRVPH